MRRSAFQEAIAHLGKAIAMADKAAGGKGGGRSASSRNCTSPTATRSSRRAATGAPETTEAFARARESALGDKDAPERLAADYGLWVGSLLRGELSAMRAHADGLPQRRRGETRFARGRSRSPRGRESRIGSPESIVEAREHLERALALFQPGRDDDLAFRFGHGRGRRGDALPRARVVAAGRRRARDFPRRDAEARIAGLAHIGTRAHGKMHAAMFELMRGDLSRAAPNAARTRPTRARA